jgi:ABC-2 type transport system permease protein
MLKKYLAFARAAWGFATEYRAQIVIWMTGSLFMLIMLAVWLRVSEKGAVNGFKAGDFVAYYMVGFVVRNLTAVWASWEMEYQIREGKLSPLLLRPIHPIHNDIASNWPEKMLRILVASPVAVIGFLLTPGASLNLTFWSVPCFLLAVLGAWLITFLTDYLIGLLSFWTTQTSAFIMGFYGVRLTLTGIMAPIAMFPQAMQDVLQWTPFPYMLNFPVGILTKGMPTNNLLLGFAIQWFWVFAFILLVRLVWKFAMRSYSAVGA